MTGNKAYLAEYQDFNGGPVAFGGSKGYITSKGKIKTGKLDFEDLPDENQVLLRIPRQNNMYNFNLENIVPFGGLACLIAKATIDESNKWHRRLGYVNFKNLNKLVKGNLVRGLPSKIFHNDHTYVACQKGKQHKASCKAKLVSSISQPLQLLRMDLFGPTSVRSLNHKTYCLVITDDFSRVLVTKPQNKIPYELITGKIPIISYIRPFGCHVTILNTIDRLGKFDGKSDEGFLVGYSIQSKAFREYNLETKRVEENLHITFLENKPNVVGKGPTWLFDLDYLTDSMNYQPVRSENQANKHAGPQEANHNAVKRSIEKNVGEAPTKHLDLKTNENPVDKEDQGVVADFTNLEPVVNVSPIPTSRINSIHPSTLILGDPQSAVQTRKVKVTKSSGAILLICLMGRRQLEQNCYRNKKDERGVVVINKARLVAQGHRQEEGIDYDEVLERIGSVAYKLELPQELSRVHNTFHVSNMKKCYSDEPLAVPLEGLHIDDKLQFVEETVEIMELEIKRLKRSRIPLVKVRWNSRRGPEFTWEREDSFKNKYPRLFINRASSSTTTS
ncbi:retrovirus-related pol polyprotein from transposon TNT 1-94 [Tanacetum coccineum]